MDATIESTVANLTLKLTVGEAQILFDGLDPAHDEWSGQQMALMQHIQQTLCDHFEIEEKKESDSTDTNQRKRNLNTSMKPCKQK